MAGADRAQAQHLTFLASVSDAAQRFGLFPLVRGAEARAVDLPRVGQSKRPEQNIVDLAQTPKPGLCRQHTDHDRNQSGSDQGQRLLARADRHDGAIADASDRICLLRKALCQQSAVRRLAGYAGRADAPAVLPRMGRFTACGNVRSTGRRPVLAISVCAFGCDGRRAGRCRVLAASAGALCGAVRRIAQCGGDRGWAQSSARPEGLAA